MYTVILLRTLSFVLEIRDFKVLIHPELKYSPSFKVNLIYVLSERGEAVSDAFVESLIYGERFSVNGWVCLFSNNMITQF